MKVDFGHSLGIAVVLCISCRSICPAATFEIHPATVEQEEEFERVANALKPGDELILHDGIYSQTDRRALTVQGTPDKSITIRAADGARPLLTRPAADLNRHNNVEFIDCCYMVVRGLRFKGGSSGVRFIRGHHIPLKTAKSPTPAITP